MLDPIEEIRPLDRITPSRHEDGNLHLRNLVDQTLAFFSGKLQGIASPLAIFWRGVTEVIVLFVDDR
jgi:hypothetical protein